MRPFIETIGKCTTAYVLCYPNAGMCYKGLSMERGMYMGLQILIRSVCFTDLGIQLTFKRDFPKKQFEEYFGLDQYFPLYLKEQFDSV